MLRDAFDTACDMLGGARVMMHRRHHAPGDEHEKQRPEGPLRGGKRALHRA